MRHYGFLANRVKEERLQRCCTLLGQSTPAEPKESRSAVALLLRLTGIDVTQCPRCQKGTMHVVAALPSLEETPAGSRVPAAADSS